MLNPVPAKNILRKNRRTFLLLYNIERKTVYTDHRLL